MPRAKSTARKLTMAQRADRHDLYEQAVQNPADEVAFVLRTYKKIRGREPTTLREDFAGTSIFSLTFVQTRDDRRAWAVDLDDEVMSWGRTQRIEPAGSDVAARVQQLHANVLEGTGPKTDVAVAFNFSYWLFEERATMIRYFKTVRSKLGEEGVLFLDAFGGIEAQQPDENRVKLGGFTYVWQQIAFDPITHHMDCAIHFEFSDGSRLDRAYTYSWRVWSIPEIRDMLLEAGFSKVHVYWEKTDEDGEGTGVFFEPKRGVDNQAVWWTYIAAER